MGKDSSRPKPNKRIQSAIFEPMPGKLSNSFFASIVLRLGSEVRIFGFDLSRCAVWCI